MWSLYTVLYSEREQSEQNIKISTLHSTVESMVIDNYRQSIDTTDDILFNI
jgi:hypothetical protein